MNIKNKVIIASILILAMIPLVVSNTFAQIYWPSCKISAYGNNVDFYTTSTTNQNRYQFTVRAPPEGSNITNTIEVANDDTGENYVETLSPGDVVYVNWIGISPTVNEYTPGEQMGYYSFLYDGAVAEVQINSIQIPEFSSTFFVILFMVIPLIAIIYSKKRIPKK
jgi:hypothetical protein